MGEKHTVSVQTPTSNICTNVADSATLRHHPMLEQITFAEHATQFKNPSGLASLTTPAACEHSCHRERTERHLVICFQASELATSGASAAIAIEKSRNIYDSTESIRTYVTRQEADIYEHWQCMGSLFCPSGRRSVFVATSTAGKKEPSGV